MSKSTTQQPLLKSRVIDTTFGTVDYSAGIIDDVANLVAANGTSLRCHHYVDTTVDVEINDAATIAQIMGIDTAFGTVDYSVGIVMTQQTSPLLMAPSPLLIPGMMQPSMSQPP